MDSILFLIAQFLTTFATGLDVVPFAGDCKTYVFTHPVGVFLLKLENGRFTIELAFRASKSRTAGVYLADLQKALEKVIPVDEKSHLEFTFEKNHYLGWDPATSTDFHSATFQMRVRGRQETPDTEEDVEA